MGNFQLPKTTVLDANGNPVSGGKLYFYLTGTSTPEAIYQDEANLTPHANPVVADSAGRVAPIYLQTSKTYKLVVKDAADTTLYTIDPVKSYALAGASISTRLLQVASTPLDYSGVGDGVANDAAAVQSAINSASGTVDLLGKTYKCNSAVTVPSGKRIVNGTLDFSDCLDAWCINITGTYNSGTEYFLNADCAVGDTVLTLTSVSGLAVGEWLRLWDNQSWYTGIDAGELVRIKSINAGALQITLTGKTLGAYAWAQSAKLVRITPKSNVTLRDLKIICAQSVSQAGIGAAWTENLQIHNVKITGVNIVGIVVQSSVHTAISQCDINRTRDTTYGTGIKVNRGIKGLTISDCRIDDSPIGIEVGGDTSAVGDVGLCREIAISNCVINGSIYAGIWLRPSQYVTVNNCVVVCGPGASSDGIVDNGSDNTIRNCTIRHAHRYGALLQPLRSLSYATAGGGTPASKTDELSTRFTDNVIEFCGSDGVRVVDDAASLDLAGCIVSRNEINGVGGYGVYVGITNKNCTNLRIDDNTISASTESPIYVTVAAAKTLRRFSISGNIAEGHASTKDGIQLIGGDASSIQIGRVSGNDLTGGRYGIALTQVHNAVCGRNVLHSSATLGMLLTNCSVLSVVDNDVFPTVTGIKYTNTAAQTDVTIANNRVVGGTGYAYHVNADESITRLSVCRNDSYSTSTANERCRIEVANTKTISDLALLGNRFNQSGDDTVAVRITCNGTVNRFAILGNSTQQANAAGDNCGIQINGGGTLSNGGAFGNVYIGGNIGLESSVNTATNCAAGANYGVALGASAVSVIGGAWTYAATSATAADLPTLR
jgi:hypothetical protein